MTAFTRRGVKGAIQVQGQPDLPVSSRPAGLHGEGEEERSDIQSHPLLGCMRPCLESKWVNFDNGINILEKPS